MKNPSLLYNLKAVMCDFFLKFYILCLLLLSIFIGGFLLYNLKAVMLVSFWILGYSHLKSITACLAT